jgi:hypothetical protein
MFQSLRIEVHIKKDGVKMGRHDDIGVNTQVFVPDTVIETVGDDPAGYFVNEDRKPFDDREGHII